MRKLYIVGLIAVAALVIGIAIADEIKFSTYYPAPAGVYRLFTTTGKTCLATNQYGTETDANVGIGTTDPGTAKLAVIGGNVGIGTTSPNSNAPNETTTGNLDVNDVYLRSVSNWASQGGGVPVGSVIAYMAQTVPAGWLECDSSSVLIDDYPALFAVIGYMYGGSGDSFKVPDLRGYFLRGWDHGAGRDPDASGRTGGNTVGSTQQDELKSHSHGIRFYGSQDADTDKIGATNWHTTYSTNTEAFGGLETRPKNIYVMYIIKAN